MRALRAIDGSKAGRAHALVLAVLVLAGGCRDATQPFEAEDQPSPVEASPRRLTYSPGDDRAPAWSAGSDTVYYSAELSDYTELGFVLSALSRAGGVAQLLLRGQTGLSIERRAIEPAPSPVSSELAFLEMGALRDSPCDADTIACPVPEIEALEPPRFSEAWLGVADSPQASVWRRLYHILLPGTSVTVFQPNGGNHYRTRYLPWHFDWADRRAMPMRPSWSPDGQRLAVVDSLGLQIVDAETGTATFVAPGYIGNPAWSPDGQWIAFDRIEIVDSTGVFCSHLGFTPDPDVFDFACSEQRWVYTTTAPILELIRPDGSERTTLGTGEEPAWYPDGSRLLYVEDERIVVRDIATGGIAPLAGTDGGAEPAVSPDGRWLAFTRFDENAGGFDPNAGGRDVWVLRLPDAP